MSEVEGDLMAGAAWTVEHSPFHRVPYDDQRVSWD